MSDKQDQKKKDGERADKKHQAMHASEHARKEQAEKTAAHDPHQITPGLQNRTGTKNA